jgi:hypothetical protein
MTITINNTGRGWRFRQDCDRHDHVACAILATIPDTACLYEAHGRHLLAIHLGPEHKLVRLTAQHVAQSLQHGLHPEIRRAATIL